MATTNWSISIQLRRSLANSTTASQMRTVTVASALLSLRMRRNSSS